MSYAMQAHLRRLLVAIVVALLGVGSTACGGTSGGDDVDDVVVENPQGMKFEIVSGSPHLIKRVVIRNAYSGDEIEDVLGLCDTGKTTHVTSVPDIGFYYVKYYRRLKHVLNGPEEAKYAQNPATGGHKFEIRDGQLTYVPLH